jgi:ATP-dependent DNA helicase RecG
MTVDSASDIPWMDQPATVLRGVGPKRAGQLRSLGIETIGDLLFHFPRDYEDRSAFTPAAEVRKGETATISARVVSARAVRLRRRMAMTEAVLEDDSGRVKAVWFGLPYLARSITPGALGVFTGLVYERKGLVLKNPEYEWAGENGFDEWSTGRIVPRYPLTEGLGQRFLRGLTAAALEGLEGGVGAAAREQLPRHLLERRRLPEALAALRSIHYPGDTEEARQARARFAYEELLGIQLGVLSTRKEAAGSDRGRTYVLDGPALGRLRETLPFQLTAAQQRAVEEILGDLRASAPMMRLVQGDVGCGKTAVAAHAMAAAADSGCQSAVMAPTEILAEQHALTLRGLLEPLGLRVEALTGSRKDAADVRERIAAGQVHVVAGTHALIQEQTRFHCLGLIVVDEQHRFGVLHRRTLAEKGAVPDILHMTATPIPRSLALTVYGGMDLTLIDELPPGRLPVKTSRLPESKLPGLFEYIREQAERGCQTYWICPLVEESDKSDLTSVIERSEELAAGPLNGLRSLLLHGRMALEEKATVMNAWRRGEADVLFSTTVVEVGVDCPAAAIAVIEDAGQFGLTQLHQLRGRVGRGAEQSFCFLLGKPKTREGRERLRILCETASGFDIAEADLAMRGPGEFHGVRQAGYSDLRVADLVQDARLIDAARRDAAELLEADPRLSEPSHRHLRALAARFRRLNA